MPTKTKDDKGSQSQLERFKQAAREVGADEDPERFKEMVRKVAKATRPQSNAGQNRKAK